MRTIPEQGERTGFLLRMPTAMHSALRDLAESHHRSMNAQIVYLIERELEAQIHDEDRGAA